MKLILLYGDEDDDEVVVAVECLDSLLCDEWIVVLADWEDFVDLVVLREGDRIEVEDGNLCKFGLDSDCKLTVDVESGPGVFIEEEKLWQVLHRIGTDFSWPIINGIQKIN